MKRSEAYKQVGNLTKTVQHNLRKALDDALRPLGMTAAQYFAMRKIIDYDGISNADLSRKCLVTPQTMNEIIAGLEKAGRLHRVSQKGHGRVQKITLTDSGRALLADADALALRVEDLFFRGLSFDEVKQLAELLGKLEARTTDG